MPGAARGANWYPPPTVPIQGSFTSWRSTVLKLTEEAGWGTLSLCIPQGSIVKNPPWSTILTLFAAATLTSAMGMSNIVGRGDAKDRPRQSA